MTARDEMLTADTGATSGGAIEVALGALRMVHGPGYRFGYDRERCVFWVITRDLFSSLLFAPTPTALVGLISAAEAAS